MNAPYLFTVTRRHPVSHALYCYSPLSTRSKTVLITILSPAERPAGQPAS
jgi:hypothetical protein